MQTGISSWQSVQGWHTASTTFCGSGGGGQQSWHEPAWLSAGTAVTRPQIRARATISFAGVDIVASVNGPGARAYICVLSNPVEAITPGDELCLSAATGEAATGGAWGEI